MNGALRLSVAGLSELIAFSFANTASAQWAPSLWPAVSPIAVERSLEAQGYGLVAPIVGRPGIYLADVVAGAAGYERLVIDARSGQILERFPRAARMWGPALAARDEQFGELLPDDVGPPWGPGFSNGPGAGPSAYGDPGSVHSSGADPYDRQEGLGGTKPKPKPLSTGRKALATKELTANPPLPPRAPREAAKPDGSVSLASGPAEKHEPGQTAGDHAPPIAPPAAPIMPVEVSDKPKVSIVPPALFE
jgi:hypothetical protein